MARKIRFPLRMADGAEVKDLEQLREHFDLQTVVEHYKSGKLLNWLEARYLEGEAEAVRELDDTTADFQKQLCEALQVEYTGDEVDLEAIALRQERLKRLRAVTDEAEYIENIDRVAFDQEDLADLLDENESTIYLCGEKFTVPVSRKNITYIGIQNPEVHISGELPENPGELGIRFQGIECDNLPKIAPEEKQIAHYATTEIPHKLLLGVLRKTIRHLVRTEHYYVYTHDLQNWTRYCIETGEEIVCPKEYNSILVHTLTAINDACVFDHQVRSSTIICGDEIACFILDCRKWRSIDIASFKVQDYSKDIFDEAGEFAFSSKHYATCRKFSSSYYEIKLHERNPAGSEAKEIKVPCTNISFFGGRSMRFYQEKLYFPVGESKLGQFSPDANQVVVFDVPYGSYPVAWMNQYLYLFSTNYDDYSIYVLNLESGKVESRFSFKVWDGYIRVYDKYILYYGTNSQGSNKACENLFVIEMETCNAKNIPFDFFQRDNVAIVSDSTLYCCIKAPSICDYWESMLLQGTDVDALPYSKLELAISKACIGYKFDLTEDVPRKEKFTFYSEDVTQDEKKIIEDILSKQQ